VLNSSLTLKTDSKQASLLPSFAAVATATVGQQLYDSFKTGNSWTAAGPCPALLNL